MTFWARLESQGPWLESDVVVRSDTFEVHPLVGTVPVRTVEIDGLTGVEDGPAVGPDERVVTLHSDDGTRLQLRGSALGVSSLVAAMGPWPDDTTDDDATDGDATDGDAPGSPPAEAGDPVDPLAPADRAQGPRWRFPAVVAGAAAFIVALGFWNHSANQQELRELAARKHPTTSAPTTSTTTQRPPPTAAPTTALLPPPEVLGTTTIRPPASTTVPTRPTTTAPRVPTTTAPIPTAPGTRLLIGSVSLRQVQHWGDTVPECRGVGQLSDVGTGTPVVVRNAEGAIIAEGTLGGCRFVAPGSELSASTPAPQTDGSIGGIPRFDLQIADIADSSRYTVQVGRYDPVGFSRSEIGSGVWRIRMVISAG